MDIPSFQIKMNNISYDILKFKNRYTHANFQKGNESQVAFEKNSMNHNNQVK